MFLLNMTLIEYVRAVIRTLFIRNAICTCQFPELPALYHHLPGGMSDSAGDRHSQPFRGPAMTQHEKIATVLYKVCIEDVTK